MNAPLFNACTVGINEGAASPVVNVEYALYGQLEPMTFTVIDKDQDPLTFEVTEVRRSLETMALIQPLKVRELAIKEEGERRWSWQKVYALPNTPLAPKDVIEFRGVKFRIMGAKNWQAKGYMYYEMVEDYQVPNDYDFGGWRACE